MKSEVQETSKRIKNWEIFQEDKNLKALEPRSGPTPNVIIVENWDTPESIQRNY